MTVEKIDLALNRRFGAAAIKTRPPEGGLARFDMTLAGFSSRGGTSNGKDRKPGSFPAGNTGRSRGMQPA